MDQTGVRHALADALSFVLPIDCAGCAAPDAALCDECLRALAPDVRTQHVAGVPVASALVFDGVAARVLRALKEDGRTSLARALAPALRAAAASVLGPGDDVAVVPMPTSRAAMRRRGYRVAELLARRAGWPPERALRIVRATADQRGLGRAARGANVAGTMRARAVAGRRVLLVDDVVTTGATLSEAIRAIEAAGATVIGAVTVAMTPRRRPGESYDTPARA